MENMWLSCILPTIVGAEPGDEDNTQDQDQDEDQDQSGAGGAGDDRGQGESKDQDENKGDPQKKITAQQEILDRKEAQLNEKETELQELRKFKKEQEDAKLSDKEKRDQEQKELQTKNENLTKSVEKLVLKNAFLSSNDYEWHKPETALSLADLSEVEIVEENGAFKVKDPKKLAAALKALAESDPYLLKAKSNDEDEDKSWKGKSGDPSKKVPNQKQETERAKLRNKYPALRNR